ncbi:hypothetical protein F0365_01720 [Nonlabens sp. Ci31]|uniref:hypothetical protein n=1 Tax=Nonlabens sp. Ci31 TaxID=2608253 RepID=UPI001464854F|nr:hypothetical protein [Nonlabens sp. Ci31]QJP33217.1 hypothetical protein F0365_01720 [Nonlabens sp. Ci31]
MGSSFDDVFKKESHLQDPQVDLNKGYLVYAIIAGIIYFIVSTLEIITDIGYSIEEEQLFAASLYTVIKSISLIAGTFFFYGSFLIGKAFKSPLILITSTAFIIIWLLMGAIDGFIYVHELHAREGYQIARIVISGLLYTFIGAGYFLKRKQIGKVSKWLGLSGLMVGICLVTIILVLPGAIIYSVFEILLIILMYQLWSKEE